MTTTNQSNELLNIIYFVIKNYPSRIHLSKARLTKIIFLMDWKASLDLKKQITNIEWYFDTYGPYVNDVIKIAESHKDLFVIKSILNDFNNPSTYIDINKSEYKFEISNEIINIYNFIIEKTKRMSFNEFIDFVYSTYPIQVSNRYSFLNLLELADAYKKL